MYFNSFAYACLEECLVYSRLGDGCLVQHLSTGLLPNALWLWSGVHNRVLQLGGFTLNIKFPLLTLMLTVAVFTVVDTWLNA